jgi:nucleoside-triphosphatase
MHVFLTGEIQIGKSTALRRFLARTGVAADGFLTVFDSREASRELFISPFDAGEKYRVARINSGGVTVYGEVFDTRGAALLNSAGRRQMIVMDELGSMEENSPVFKAAVLRRLDGDFPVAGVVKLRASPFLDAVRAHPNVKMITVTPENRDAGPAMLTEAFQRITVLYRA